jgi:hypothetical protein
MKDYYHYVFGFIWLAVCALLGLYVGGRGISGRKHYTIGFRALFLAYLCGLCLLFIAITLS